MKNIRILSDYDDPMVKSKAADLVRGETTIRGKLEKLFYYVRDDIDFGFTADGDIIKASEIIKLGMGQCNNKGTLFLALCKAVSIPARIHFSLIRKEIQAGLFTGIFYRLLPPLLSHSWIDVHVDGKWIRIDSYINDQPFYLAGRKKLRENGWDTGYSISCSSGESSAEFNLDAEKFVQMDAVVEDHGVWEDPGYYYATDLYKNRPNAIKLLVYRLFIPRTVNKKIARMRSECSSGLCGSPALHAANV
ncbi:MAG: transglutaminase family protein [Spirochaetes bacterium]|nr:transglutaminase family protein [Spirochaetota bacterium]